MQVSDCLNDSMCFTYICLFFVSAFVSNDFVDDHDLTLDDEKTYLSEA